MAKTIRKASKDQSKTPLVSVVMSVYNGEQYLREAIDSILSQTFTDFEFIIINDGSTDDTLKIIKSYKDPRIVVISRKNKGLVASLNEGIKRARGKYIARQDADDISAPLRFAMQVPYLEKGAVLVSSAFAMFKKSPIEPFVTHYLLDDDIVLKRLINVKNPFAHGATMYKREVAVRAGLYRDVGPVEDYDLWMRLMGAGETRFINQVLYSWRINSAGITQSRADEQAVAAGRLVEALDIAHAPKLKFTKLLALIKKYRSYGRDVRAYIKPYLFDGQIRYVKKCFAQGSKKRGIVELYLAGLIQPDFFMYVLRYVKNRMLGSSVGEEEV